MIGGHHFFTSGEQLERPGSDPGLAACLSETASESEGIAISTSFMRWTQSCPICTTHQKQPEECRIDRDLSEGQMNKVRLANRTFAEAGRAGLQWHGRDNCPSRPSVPEIHGNLVKGGSPCAMNGFI